MTTFWEGAVHSVNRMFSLYNVYLFICYFGCFAFWFRGWDCCSDCASSWSLLTFLLGKVQLNLLQWLTSFCGVCSEELPLQFDALDMLTGCNIG